MNRSTGLLIFTLGVFLLVGLGALWMLTRHGFRARAEPSVLEALAARRLRALAMPAAARDAPNPVEASPEVLKDAMAHFADHCAVCHANDGSGDTELGRNLYPPAPDMRKAPTQSLTDGEIFYVIHNGIRFTGMPAWGPEDPAEDRGSWELVHFIRHLPELTKDELAHMKTLNPKSRHEIEEEEAIQSFLEGGDTGGHAHDHRH